MTGERPVDPPDDRWGWSYEHRAAEPVSHEERAFAGALPLGPSRRDPVPPDWSDALPLGLEARRVDVVARSIRVMAGAAAFFAEPCHGGAGGRLAVTYWLAVERSREDASVSTALSWAIRLGEIPYGPLVEVYNDVVFPWLRAAWVALSRVSDEPTGPLWGLAHVAELNGVAPAASPVPSTPEEG